VYEQFVSLLYTVYFGEEYAEDFMKESDARELDLPNVHEKVA
jgi:hypothetical protein